MNRRAFIDAQGWVALKHRNDRHFNIAHQAYQSLIMEQGEEKKNPYVTQVST